MKIFSKFFWFLFLFLVGCEHKPPANTPSFLIIWEWKAPQQNFIRQTSIQDNTVFLLLNNGEIAYFSLDRPHEITTGKLPFEGLISVLWTTKTSNEYSGVAWTTAGTKSSLTWFSTSLATNITNTQPPTFAITQTLSLTYTKIYGLWQINDTLFWAADDTLFMLPIDSQPDQPQKIPFPFPFPIVDAARYKNTLYLAQQDKGLSIVDLKTKKTTNFSWIIGSVESVVVVEKEHTLILGDRINGLRAYDIQNPWNPRFISVYESLGNTLDLALSPQGFWLADQYNGVSLLSLKEGHLSLRTNITGRVISHVLYLPGKEKLLLWHNDLFSIASVSNQ